MTRGLHLHADDRAGKCDVCGAEWGDPPRPYCECSEQPTALHSAMCRTRFPNQITEETS